LAFNGFAPEFAYRSIPTPDLTIEQVVQLDVILVRRTLTWHADARGKGYGCR
jgi:hypothetical protein